MWQNAFKTYDIRGRIPEELNGDIVYKIGQSLARLFPKAQQAVVGYDAREDSQELANILQQSLLDVGCNVTCLGLCGTEQVYFYTGHLHADMGLMVTASHNPKGYNGIKIVQKNAAPLSDDKSLAHLKILMEDYQSAWVTTKGIKIGLHHKDAYIKHLLSYVHADGLKPLTIVTNAGNGGAGLVIDALEAHLPCTFIKIHHQPDGSFPYGVPNPLLPENRHHTSQAVIEHQADFGIAWDGDYDRCFFFDHEGNFIEGYYLVGLSSGYFAAVSL